MSGGKEGGRKRGRGKERERWRKGGQVEEDGD